ncbi:MAG: N-acetylmuramic acid 6-phosphate etherase [Bdellovibrionales bacterium]|nr:N-acetylmuramic acid 6-phosphate etherase [Bdellovibrionales bacterium]
MKSLEPESLKEKTLLLTEQYNPNSENIDTLSSLEIVDLFNREDAYVLGAVRSEREKIAKVIDWSVASIESGGRLIYVGAGTSGRLGVLDAAECPPTFGTNPSPIVAIIAGGERAVTNPIENVEDNMNDGEQDIDSISINSNDVIIGLSSSSTTPYVHGALKKSKEKGAKTVLLTATNVLQTYTHVDLILTFLTGPEIITGSTRLKAGTATKLVLNIISTGVMTKLGKTYGNLMADLAISNVKLLDRAIRIVENITGRDYENSKILLKQAGHNVKTAIAMDFLNLNQEKALAVLKENHYKLRNILNRPHKKNQSIKAVLFDMDGTILRYGLRKGYSTWAALGQAYGIFEEMEKWVAEYLSGEKSYESIWKRCADYLKGKSTAKAEAVLFPLSGLPPTSRGFQECVEILKPHYKLGIVSSGLSYVAQKILATYGFDFQVSNVIGIKDGVFDGSYQVKVPFNHKVEVVKQVCSENKLDLKEVCFVGDSTNDEEVLASVGLPIAYRPTKSSVTRAAQGHTVNDFFYIPKTIESKRN